VSLLLRRQGQRVPITCLREPRRQKTSSLSLKPMASKGARVQTDLSSPLGMDLCRMTTMLNGRGGRPCRDMTHDEVMVEIGHEWGVEWRARAEDVSFPELLETVGACALSGVFPHSTQAMMAYRDGSVRRADFAATVPTADKVQARPHPHATPACEIRGWDVRYDGAGWELIMQ